MPRTLDTQPWTVPQLRRAWVERPDARDLLAEIHRLHNILRDINHTRGIIEKAFLEAGGGRLMALHQLKIMLSNEPAVDRLYADQPGTAGGAITK